MCNYIPPKSQKKKRNINENQNIYHFTRIHRHPSVKNCSSFDQSVRKQKTQRFLPYQKGFFSWFSSQKKNLPTSNPLRVQVLHLRPVAHQEIHAGLDQRLTAGPSCFHGFRTGFHLVHFPHWKWWREANVSHWRCKHVVKQLDKIGDDQFLCFFMLFLCQSRFLCLRIGDFCPPFQEHLWHIKFMKMIWIWYWWILDTHVIPCHPMSTQKSAEPPVRFAHRSPGAWQSLWAVQPRAIRIDFLLTTFLAENRRWSWLGHLGTWSLRLPKWQAATKLPPSRPYLADHWVPLEAPSKWGPIDGHSVPCFPCPAGANRHQPASTGPASTGALARASSSWRRFSSASFFSWAFLFASAHGALCIVHWWWASTGEQCAAAPRWGVQSSSWSVPSICPPRLSCNPSDCQLPDIQKQTASDMFQDMLPVGNQGLQVQFHGFLQLFLDGLHALWGGSVQLLNGLRVSYHSALVKNIWHPQQKHLPEEEDGFSFLHKIANPSMVI